MLFKITMINLGTILIHLHLTSHELQTRDSIQGIALKQNIPISLGTYQVFSTYNQY